MARQLHEQKDSIINSIEAQRNSALNQVAQMQVIIDDMKAQHQSDISDISSEIKDLRAELEKSKNPVKKRGSK